MKNGTVLAVDFTPHTDKNKCITETTRYKVDRHGNAKNDHRPIYGRIPKDAQEFMATHKLEVRKTWKGQIYYHFE